MIGPDRAPVWTAGFSTRLPPLANALTETDSWGPFSSANATGDVPLPRWYRPNRMSSELPIDPSRRPSADRWQNGWSLLRAALAGGERDYTQGSVGQAVVLLAIPMMLEMAMESIFAIVDIFFVARLGAAAVAAVGLTEAVLTLLYAVAVGLSLGVTALVARRIGERDPEAAATTAGQTVWVGLAASVLVGGVGIAFAPELLAAMGAGPDVVADGAGYMA